MTTARILKYKCPHTMREILIIANGKPTSVIGIHLNKTFKARDAQKIIDLIENGRF